jgi:hypothetical protein
MIYANQKGNFKMTDPQETERILVKMKVDCEASIVLLTHALTLAKTPEIENLSDQWKYAQSAVGSILDSFYDDPTRDCSGVMHCVLWFMVVHSKDLELLKDAVNQVAAPPETKGKPSLPNRRRKKQ